jgi:hypothetical protein
MPFCLREGCGWAILSEEKLFMFRKGPRRTLETTFGRSFKGNGALEVDMYDGGTMDLS